MISNSKRAITLAVVCLIALAGCARDTTGPGSEDAVGGAGHEELPEPVTITPGEYQTTVYSEAETQRRMDVLDQREGYVPFSGTVAGITVDHLFTQPCATEWEKMIAVEREPYEIGTPTDLPPGATQVYAPEGWKCLPNTPLFIERRFTFAPWLDGVEMGIIRLFNTSTLQANTWPEAVSSGTIQGRPAILIEPITDVGAGNSWVAFMDGDDLWVFIGLDIRFDDLIRIAESTPL